MPGLLNRVGGAIANTARGVGGAIMAIPQQIGYEIGQYGRGLGSLARGDVEGAVGNFTSANVMGAGSPMYDAFTRPFREGGGSVVGRGYIGGSGRGGGASRAGGRRGQQQMATQRWLAGEDSAEGPQVGDTVGRRPRGGMLSAPQGSPSGPRNDVNPTGPYGGAARLGTGQAAAGERHLREMIARQHQRPDAER